MEEDIEKLTKGESWVIIYLLRVCIPKKEATQPIIIGTLYLRYKLIKES